MHIIKVLPKNLLSQAFGTVMGVRLPTPLGVGLNRAIARTLKIDLAEAEHPVGQYASFKELFTRRLKPGSRRWVGPLASPCDGTLTHSDEVLQGAELIVKGMGYSVEQLLCGQDQTLADFNPSWATTIYLAPHNYHRVHMPFKGKLLSIRHIGGNLWPVQNWTLKLVPDLFCRNERVIFELADDESKGKAFLVMVGAMNVGRIIAPDQPDLMTNVPRGRAINRFKALSPPVDKALGDELGIFDLGSTVVMVFDDRMCKHYRVTEGLGPVLAGNPIAKVNHPL